jgi:hypothetical protein
MKTKCFMCDADTEKLVIDYRGARFVFMCDFCYKRTRKIAFKYLKAMKKELKK